VCSRCWGLRNQVPCTTCGEVRPRVNSVRQPAVCGRWWTAARPMIECAWCGDRRQAGGRDDKGRAICPRCAHRRRDRIRCVDCAQMRRPHSRVDGGHLCSACAGRRRQPEQCGGCGRTQVVVARADDGSARCHRCWAATHERPALTANATERSSPGPKPGCRCARPAPTPRRSRTVRWLGPGRRAPHCRRRRPAPVRGLLAGAAVAVHEVWRGRVGCPAVARGSGMQRLRRRRPR
jgi:hypothetical protein